MQKVVLLLLLINSEKEQKVLKDPVLDGVKVSLMSVMWVSFFCHLLMILAVTLAERRCSESVNIRGRRG